MPDLGKYAVFVLSAYGVSLALLAGLVALTLWRGARVRAALAAQEARMGLRAAGSAGQPGATGLPGAGAPSKRGESDA